MATGRSIPPARPGADRTGSGITVLCDVDGTLLTGSGTHLDALAAAAASVLAVPVPVALAGEVPVLAGIPVAGCVDAECFRMLATRAGVPVTAVTQAAFLDEYAHRHAALLAAGGSPGVLLPGVATTLATLAADGVQLALATGNAHRVAAAKLAACGIAGPFTFDPALGFGDTHPDRRAVVAAALAGAGAGAHPARRATVLVGDTAADMTAAWRNGVCAVGVTTGADSAARLYAAGAHLVLASFAELPDALTAPGIAGLRAIPCCGLCGRPHEDGLCGACAGPGCP